MLIFSALIYKNPSPTQAGPIPMDRGTIGAYRDQQKYKMYGRPYQGIPPQSTPQVIDYGHGSDTGPRSAPARSPYGAGAMNGAEARFMPQQQQAPQQRPPPQPTPPVFEGVCEKYNKLFYILEDFFYCLFVSYTVRYRLNLYGFNKTKWV